MTDVVNYLISLGASVKIRNIRGFTPIELAEQLENKEIITILKNAAQNQKGEEDEDVKVNTGDTIKEYLKDLTKEVPKAMMSEIRPESKINESESALLNSAYFKQG